MVEKCLNSIGMKFHSVYSIQAYRHTGGMERNMTTETAACIYVTFILAAAMALLSFWGFLAACSIMPILGRWDETGGDHRGGLPPRWACSSSYSSEPLVL